MTEQRHRGCFILICSCDRRDYRSSVGQDESFLRGLGADEFIDYAKNAFENVAFS